MYTLAFQSKVININTDMENTKQLPAYDFIALGEALVDFISTDLASSLNESMTFQRFIGGQATNLSMNMARFC